MVFFLALTSAFLFGISDFSGGWATRLRPVRAVLFSSQLFGLALIVVLSPLVFSGVPAWQDLAWGAAAGLGGAAGISFLYYGLAHSLVSIVSPVAALVGALLPLVFGLLTGDGLTPAGWAGIAFILPAVILLSYEHRESVSTPVERLRAFGFGTLAGAGFGLFFILIAQTSPSAGLWPLAGARAASLVLVGLLGAGTGKPLLVRGRGLPATAVAGLLDMAANIAFMLAVQSGMIILVTAVTSIYPAPTVLLARIISKEKIHPLRWAGLAAAAAGVAFMGTG
jgi:drug/metabolite transporter (DMT)-like permease